MPQSFGKYEMLSRIASGGMAEVWLARSSSIGGFEKLFAIKKMHASLSKNHSFVSMFIDEAKLTVSLAHPNIVQIYDFGRVDDDYFMAMELIEGTDLATIARRARRLRRPLPIDVSLNIMLGVFEGLAYAHARRDRHDRPASVIHRDVSPQNILVSFEGRVKVSDFGIARAASKIVPKKGEGLFGKAAYLAPEQCTGHPVTPATDIWSAGVILHELLANGRLFLKKTDLETIAAVTSAKIQGPSEANPSVPPELDTLTLAVLSRDPGERPSSAYDVVDSLRAIIDRHYRAFGERRIEDALSELWEHALPRLEHTPSSKPNETWVSATARQRATPETASGAPLPRRKSSTRAEPHPTAPSRGRARGLRPTKPRPNSPTQIGLGRAIVEPFANEEDPPNHVDRVRLPPIETTRDEVARLEARFIQTPNLWTLVDIGEAWQRGGWRDRARALYELAAAKFAQRGLRVQASAIHALMLTSWTIDDGIGHIIRRVETYEGLTDEALLERLLTDSAATAELKKLRGLLTWSSEPVHISPESTMLSALDGGQLARLIPALTLRRPVVGEVIVKEGDTGDSFFLIGRGRVLVSTNDFKDERSYVTSLSDGDCFGEHGFFTGGSRTASVEALEDGLVLELSKDVLHRLMQDFPTVREALRTFYRERIAESLLAKSPLFGHLSTTIRKMFAERFVFETYDAGELILREGDRSNAFYAVKAGTVRVYRGADADPIELAELGPGDVFGEVAALAGSARTATVRAASSCEILRLEGSELKAMLAQNIEVRDLIMDKIAERAEERLRKMRNAGGVD